jgi:hypothetical protein
MRISDGFKGVAMAIKQAVLAALSRTRKSKSKKQALKTRLKVRKWATRGAGVFAAAAAAVIMVAANPIVPAATAGTIRSGSSTGACTVDVGNTSLATVVQNGNYCVVSVTGSTSVTIPGYVSTMQVMAVGGGGGGGPDGGVGGGGGEIRWSANQAVTAGQAATITIGAGGAGGVWGGANATAGGVTYISGAGLSYGANGGAGGGGWQSTTWASGGTGGYGGSSATGASGAIGPINPQNAASQVVLGSTGTNGTSIVELTWMPSLVTSGGGGGGSCYDGQNASTTGVLGAAGGAGGGGRGANYRYNLDDVTYNTNGGTTGHNGTNGLGGGGGGGMACNAGTTNGSNQRTNGGAGGSGLVRMAWLANKLAVSQAPDGCLYNVAEACLQSAKIQLQDSNNANLTTSGVTVTLALTSAGTLGGTLTANTDATGVATFNNFWITGTSIGSSVSLTFEVPGYRNVVTSVTMRGYADTLNVVSGSTDTAGSFFGTTGIWLSTATTSNVSVTTLQNELANRNVTLRAVAATASTTAGDVIFANNATVNEAATAARTITLKSSRNVSFVSGARLTSTGQPLNVVIHADSDGLNGGILSMPGSATAYAIDTNGGAVAIGGGSATMTWNSLTIPSSYANGYAAITGSWWGVELGVNTNTANILLIRTSNGPIRINGLSWASPSVTALYGISWESGKIDAGSGAVDMIGSTSGSPSPATGDNWGIGIGTNNSGANDKPVLVTTGAVTMNGSVGTAGTSNYWGTAIGYADITGGGGITISGTARNTIWTGTTVRSPITVSGPSANITGTNTFTDTLTVDVSSGDAYVSGSQSLTTANKDLTLKATGNVSVEIGASISTTGGNIVMWSDSDNASDGGIEVLSTSTVNSNGGNITMSGGTALATGYAKGTSATTTAIGGYAGVMIAGSLSSGAGNIVIRGQDSSTTGTNYGTGVEVDKAGSIQATTGSITITGTVNSANVDTGNFHNGVILGYSGTGTAAIGTTTGAINITGNTSNSNYTNRITLGLWAVNVTSTSGAVNLTATSAASNSKQLTFDGATPPSINSGSGAITLIGNTGGASDTFVAGTLTSTNSILIQSNKPTFSTSTTFTLAGAVAKVLESPSGSTSFGAAVDTTGLAVTSNTTSMRVGTTGNTANVTIGTAWTVAGPINLYGGNVTVNANMTISPVGTQFLAKATNNASLGSYTIQTNGGNVVLWSNSDKVSGVKNNSGRVSIGANANIKSNGGKIWLAGGLDDSGVDSGLNNATNWWSSNSASDGLPDGYAVGTSTAGESAGVFLGAGSLLSSAGGDIMLAGMDAPTTSDSTINCISMNGASIDSGTGRIAAYATAYGNGNGIGALALHVTDNTSETTIYSANRTAQAITLVGDARGGTNTTSDGIWAQGYSPLSQRWGYNSTHIIASGLKDSADLANKPGGGVTIIGYGANTASPSGAHGILWQWADVIAKDGPITMSGYDYDAAGLYNSAGIYVGVDNPSTYARFGAWTQFSTYATGTWTDQAGNVIDMTTSSSDITLNASKFVFLEYANAVAANGYTFKTTGNLTLQSTGSSFSSNMNQVHWRFGRITILGNPKNVQIAKSTDTSNTNWYYDINATGSIKIYGGYLYFAPNVDFITTATSGTGVLIQSNNSTLELNSTNIVQASGADIQLIADYVYVGTSSKLITTDASGQGILIKSNNKTLLNGSNTVQTSGADITFWADADNNGSGAMYLDAAPIIKSAGGKITMAGGLDDGAALNPELTGRVAGDGYPDNYAQGVAGFGGRGGVDLLSSYQVLSGGGDIFIAGQGTAASGDDDYGVILRGGMMYSDTGKIAIYGKAPASCAANWHRGIALTWNGDGGVSDYIVSNSTATDAIKLAGDMSSCNSGGSVFASAIQGFFSAGSTIATPNGGGITLDGKQGSASYAAGSWGTDYQASSILELNYVNLLSNSGPIVLNGTRTSGSGNHAIRFNTRGTGQTNNVGATTAAITTNFTAYPSINITSSTSDVTMTGDSQVLWGAYLRNTGNLVLQPQNANFDRTQYFTAANWGAYFPATYASVRIGKAGASNFGSNQSSADLYLDKFSSSGAVSIYGGTVNVVGGLTTSATSGNGILVKATGDIVATAGASNAVHNEISVTGTNSTAPVTLWSNADYSGTGAITIPNYFDVTAKAGNITIAGAASATESAPTGYAVNTGGAGVYLGISNVATDQNKITTTSGNIVVRGKLQNTSVAGTAIDVPSGVNITSGTGTITLDGSSIQPTGTSGHALYLNHYGGYTSTITTGSTTSPAIVLSGVVTSAASSPSTNANGITVWTASGAMNISATGLNADINVTGVASSGTTDSIEFNMVNMYANGGKINIDGGSQNVALSTNAGANNIGGSSSSSMSGDVTIKADQITIGTTTTTFRNASKVYLISKANSFTGAQTFGSGMATTNIGYLGVGLATNTSAITLSGTNSVAGTIDVYGAALTISGAQTTTAGGDINVNGTGAVSISANQTSADQVNVTGSSIAVSGSLSAAATTGAGILLKATGDITTSGSRSFTTSGSNATFWSDSDNNGSGRIGFDASNSITTSGGKVTIAGGADDGASTVTGSARTANDGFPDGYAAGNGSTSGCVAGTGTIQGVFFGTAMTISSGNGDIFIAGKGLTGASGNCATGIIPANDFWITAGTGKVGMYGVANAAAASMFSNGIQFYGTSTRKTIISSSNSASDAIVISGSAGPTASKRSSGIFFHGQTAGANVNNIIANTGTGGVQLVGRSTPTTAEDLTDNVGDALEMYGVAVLAKSGPISLTGATGASNTSNRYGCAFDHSSAASLTPSQSSIGARAATTVAGVDMSTSTANITLNCDSIIVGSTTQSKQFLTTGTVTIQPADGAQSFDRAVDNLGLTMGSGVSSLTIGVAGTSGSTQSNSDVTLSTATSIAGPIMVYGGDITASANLTSTLLDARIQLKATGSINQNASGVAFRTNSGKIVLWSDADATNGGMVTLKGSLCTAPTATTCDANAATGGDDIIVAGAAADSVDSTIPGGYASGTAIGAQTTTTGIQLGTMGTGNTGPKIYSSGGNITMNGQTFVTSSAVSVNSFGIMFVTGTDMYAGGGKLKFDGRNAISNISAGNVFAMELGGWGGGTTRFYSTNSASDAMVFKNTSVTTGNGLGSFNSGTEFNNANGGILVQTNSLPTSVANGFKWNVGGQIVIEPVGTSFGSAVDFNSNNIWGTNVPTGFRIGKDGNTANVTISSAVTAVGTIEAYGGTITASANLTVNTSTSAAILLKGTQDVLVGAGSNTTTRRTLQTNGGAITLWSNSDASGSGAIQLGNFSKLVSNGGAITMAGSAAANDASPTGYAKNNGTTYANGVEIGTSVQTGNVDLLSSGGDITIKGYTNANTTLMMGIRNWSGSTINSGTGAITMDGQAESCTGSITCHGLELSYSSGATTTVTSAKTSGTAISMNGSSINSTSTDSTGITIWNPITISATGGGDIVFNASAASPNTTNAMRITGANIFGKGNITFNGGKRTSFGTNNLGSANVIGGSTFATDDPGNITVTSDSVEFINVTTTFRNSGNLVIEPSSASFAENQSIPATLFAQTGNAGFRWGKSGNTATMASAAAMSYSGNVEVYGGALSNSAAVTSTGGTITYTGSTFSNTAALTTTAKDITITADQATIGAAVTTTNTTGGIVSIAPKTVGKNIDLGAADGLTARFEHHRPRQRDRKSFARWQHHRG